MGWDIWSWDLNVWENKYLKNRCWMRFLINIKKKKKNKWEPGKWGWEFPIREEKDLNSFFSSVEALGFQVNGGSGRKWMEKWDNSISQAGKGWKIPERNNPEGSKRN